MSLRYDILTFSLNRYIGLEVLSCWRDVELEGGSMAGNTNLQIGHNHFMYNEAVATKLSPLVRTVGRLEHNFYKYNKDGKKPVFNLLKTSLENFINACNGMQVFTNISYHFNHRLRLHP